MTVAPLLHALVSDKHFGGRRVLRDIDLRLHAGECVALVGASGCGKSTLLRIVAGLDRDFAGEVRLDGVALAATTRDIRFVFQEPRLFPWLTVAGNVAFDEGSRADAGRVAALLDEVGLPGLGERLPKALSGGQAQRVAIARGLFVRPRVLLLDEPFSGVDAFTRLKLQDLLSRLARAQGIAVLMVTHDIDEAVYLAIACWCWRPIRAASPRRSWWPPKDRASATARRSPRLPPRCAGPCDARTPSEGERRHACERHRGRSGRAPRGHGAGPDPAGRRRALSAAADVRRRVRRQLG